MSGPSRAPRKRVRKPPVDGLSLTNKFRSEDTELAQIVCQVVKELVYEVADEPYGEMPRKRPPFWNVLQKFVKGSMQEYHDRLPSSDYIDMSCKRKRTEEKENVVLYGLDLVWALIDVELQKTDQRDQRRLHYNEKAARMEETKRQIMADVDRSLMLADIGVNPSAFASREDEEQWLEKLQLQLMYDEAAAILAEMDESDEEREGEGGRRAMSILTPQKMGEQPPCSSPRSDDSDWLQPQSARRHSGPASSHVSSFDQVQPVRTHSIFNTRGRGRGGRGRGRGKSSIFPSIVDRKAPLHPSVSLTAAGNSPHSASLKSDFASLRKGPGRPKGGGGGRGRGGRGRGGGGAAKSRSGSTPAEWDADAEEVQRMAESIETSGESASQESLDGMKQTIDEVVARVKGMSELDELQVEGWGTKGKGKQRKEEGKEEGDKGIKRRINTKRGNGVGKKGRKDENGEGEKGARGGGNTKDDIDRWLSHSSSLVVTSALPAPRLRVDEDGNWSTVSIEEEERQGGDVRPVILARRTNEDADVSSISSEEKMPLLSSLASSTSSSSVATSSSGVVCLDDDVISDTTDDSVLFC